MWISLLSSVGSEKKRWLLNQKFKQYALIVLGGSKFIVIEGRDFFFFSCLIDVFVIYIKCTHQQLHCKLFKIQVLHEKIMYNSMATTTMVTHYNLVELSVLLIDWLIDWIYSDKNTARTYSKYKHVLNNRRKDKKTR